jgi:hypothetical protein
MDKKFEYETPRASVRGVFLCDSVADTILVSARGAITQDDWSDSEAADELVGNGTDPAGDLGVLFY